MPMQKKCPGNARQKRNCWSRGNGPDSMKGELKGGTRLNKKRLNRKVRYQKILDENSIVLRRSEYRHICRTGNMVDFTYAGEKGKDGGIRMNRNTIDRLYNSMINDLDYKDLPETEKARKKFKGGVMSDYLSEDDEEAYKQWLDMGNWP